MTKTVLRNKNDPESRSVVNAAQQQQTTNQSKSAPAKSPHQIIMEKPQESAVTSAADDDTVVLPLEKQTQRPEDRALQQQRVEAWHPILDPNWMIYSYLILAAVMIPVGTFLVRLLCACFCVVVLIDP